MIIFKHYIDLDEEMILKLNEFILGYFSHSRLYTYEIVVYTVNDNTQQITGFLGLQIFDKNILINQLCVDIKYRNQGIASNLLEYVKNNYQCNMTLYIDKNTENTNYLYNFYTKRGFVEIYSDIIKYKMYKTIL
jgi:N-acetylglutamate synthase-like GNAT family acetyltransferase